MACEGRMQAPFSQAVKIRDAIMDRSSNAQQGNPRGLQKRDAAFALSGSGTSSVISHANVAHPLLTGFMAKPGRYVREPDG
jgi:hypothetical protein